MAEILFSGFFLFFFVFFPQSPPNEDQPATATAVNNEFKEFVRKRRLVLVTAGKPGAGKSTLINNLLGLRGKKAAC